MTNCKDVESGQHVLAIGGIGIHGTRAAGELLTRPEHLDAALGNAPAGWEAGNVEIVVATTVVDGVTGPPRVIASHYWK